MFEFDFECRFQTGLKFTIKVEIEFEFDFEFKSELGLEFGGVSKIEFELDFEFLFQPRLKFFEPNATWERQHVQTPVSKHIK